MGRLRYELERLRSLGPRERVREILHVQTVSWQSQAELRDRVEALEGAVATPPAPAPVVNAPLAAPEGLAREILATQTWVTGMPPAPLRVSVVMATRSRGEQLARAIASVQAQTHPDWELIVGIDPEDADDSAGRVGALEDARIRAVVADEPGAAAVRNRAAQEATGDAIAYLDDDNVMLPHWLGAVAWALHRNPDVDVVYGALSRDFGGPVPELQLYHFHRALLREQNLADMNAVAHRRGLAGATFEEGLRHGHDWDLFERLTRAKDPLRLPVIAALYTRDAPGRLSEDAVQEDVYAAVRKRIRARSPVRVLGYNWMFPLVTETYIADELRSLVPHGAELAWYREGPATSPTGVHEPIYDDIATALGEFRPDVLFLHWLGYAVRQLPELERIGLPFGVRAHSFDIGPDGERLREHPLCVGVWSYPAPGFEEMGDFTLQPVFTGVDRLPAPLEHRDLVMSASAGLPKKDLPLLVEALAQVQGAERRIVLGITEGHENIAAEVVGLCQQHADPPLVQVNLDRDQVHALQARAAVQIYTLRPENNFGMPMSIIEGLCSGCAVIVPDRPECLAYAGPHARPYRSGADIVRHCHEVLAGGPSVADERRANMAYGRRRFCGPEHGERFYSELAGALGRETPAASAATSVA